MQVRNFYHCTECGREWTDVWSAQCDDDCPYCAAPATCRPTKVRTRRRATMNDIVSATTLHRIQVLNDFFRGTFLGGKVVITAGVAALPLDVKARVLLQVQSFAGFNSDNDPYSEHDFGGTFTVAGEEFF